MKHLVQYILERAGIYDGLDELVKYIISSIKTFNDNILDQKFDSEVIKEKTIVDKNHMNDLADYNKAINLALTTFRFTYDELKQKNIQNIFFNNLNIWIYIYDPSQVKGAFGGVFYEDSTKIDLKTGLLNEVNLGFLIPIPKYKIFDVRHTINHCFSNSQILVHEITHAFDYYKALLKNKKSIDVDKYKRIYNTETNSILSKQSDDLLMDIQRIFHDMVPDEANANIAEISAEILKCYSEEYYFYGNRLTSLNLKNSISLSSRNSLIIKDLDTINDSYKKLNLGFKLNLNSRVLVDTLTSIIFLKTLSRDFKSNNQSQYSNYINIIPIYYNYIHNTSLTPNKVFKTLDDWCDKTFNRIRRIFELRIMDANDKVKENE